VRSGIAVCVLSGVLGAACAAPAARPRPELRVCADPNNLPFSNDRLEGFENRLAAMMADDAGMELRYAWWAQRRGFIRNTLNAGECDVVMGVPASFDLALTTRPYYRSGYVWVSRTDRRHALRSLDDPGLKRLRLGVQMIGDDFSNSPPAHALASRGLVSNIVGYSVLGDYSEPNPPARIVDAVARGEVDAALVWGPLAGFFARTASTPLTLAPIEPQIDLPFLPFVFDIAMAVRRGDVQRAGMIDRFIERRQKDIDALLREFGVPRLDRSAP
jgi:quinoprotein dehydrogenase-associated probable ABC transporter substrate-binding protein